MKTDGWYNALSNAGTAKDKREYTEYKGGRVLTYTELSDMYVGDGLTGKIVDTKPDDAVRSGWYVNGDVDNRITTKLLDLDTQAVMAQALKWSRLMGGSIIVIGAMDGLTLDKPLSLNRLKDIVYLNAVERSRINVQSQDIDRDVLSPNYGKVKFYRITPREGEQYTVHYSRVLEFKGISVPQYYDMGEWYYFGMGEVQRVFHELSDYGITLAGIATLLQEFTYGVYKFSNLADMLAEGNEEVLKTRLRAVDMSKSLINSVVLDKEESFERQTLTFTGIPDILDRFMMRLAGVTDYPVTKLFGRSAAGMNSTGENDMSNYYDGIRSIQTNRLYSPLQKLVDLIVIANKINADNPTITFNSLYQKSDKEELEEQKLQAEIDQIYVNTGVLSAEEVATNRFTESGFSYETKI